jgi:L-amino acid N-acyltransferase YncA
MDYTEAPIELRDGTRLLIRPPTSRDADALLEFFGSLPTESRRLEFVAPSPELEATARWAASPDGTDHLGVVALDPGGKIVGHIACVRIYGHRGEVAVDVDQDHDYDGLVDHLIRRLACDATRQGIRTLIAEVAHASADRESDLGNFKSGSKVNA